MTKKANLLVGLLVYLHRRSVSRPAMDGSQFGALRILVLRPDQGFVLRSQ